MIDLHCHSTYSDGTCTPESLAMQGSAFALFALTDHDNCDGAKRFLSSPPAASHARRLAGIELSVEPGAGYKTFHLLGLGIDPDSPVLQRFLEDVRIGREERNRQMHARLAQLGMAFPFEELLQYAKGEIVARPHFARVMMAHGWVRDVKDAFERFLASGASAYVSRWRPQPADAIAMIHAARGIAVMAHPRFWTQDYEALATGLVRLKDAGLDGIEALYEANEPGETVEHLRVAQQLDLVVTAGSDFHGANKPTITLGMQVEREAFWVARIQEALARVRR